MKKNIRVSEPSPEMQEKIRRARCAIVNQKMRMVGITLSLYSRIPVVTYRPSAKPVAGKPYLM
mgnify:CR=1 FL=1